MKYTKIAVYGALYLFTIGIILSSIVLKPHPFDSPVLRIVRTVIIFFVTVLLTKYAVYMVLAAFYVVFTDRDKYSDSYFIKDYRPLVSVMIPCWNEEIGVLGTIRSLLSSSYKHLELVIVNDGSTDNSDVMIRRFVEKYNKEMIEIPEDQKMRIVYHYQENTGKGGALNKAITLSHGDILVSIDADCIVHKDAIAAFVESFRDPRVKSAVGNVKVGNTGTILGVTQSLEYCFGFYCKKSDSLLNTIYIVGGAAGAFRKEVFEQLGGYDTSNITEDIELSTRCQKAGMKVAYVPNAIIYTEGASTLQGLMKQRLRWKRGRFQTFWQHRDLFFSLDPKHNKVLTWVVLPLALFSEMQLAMEPVFLAVLYIIGFLSADFSAFNSGIIVVSLMFAVQAWDSKKALDNKEVSKSNIGLALIGWCLFYICSFVECYALFKSIWMMIRKKELKWQKWARKGINS